MLSPILVGDESTLEKSQYGSITGEIYFQFGDFCFPELRWNDFIVVILCWWNKSVGTLEVSSVGTTVEFHFMDGPFYVRAVKSSEEKVILNFLRRKIEGFEILASRDTEIDSLKTAIGKVSRKIVRELHRKNWSTNDTEQLESLIRKRR
ncbi:hypothetical protein [Paenibacillus chitinolyticus]|uniref:hypothetical protein n=1 Tax=Paenibacillus chitinolyticus TaxID=79263 RepID=UPI003CFBC40E